MLSRSDRIAKCNWLAEDMHGVWTPKKVAVFLAGAKGLESFLPWIYPALIPLYDVTLSIEVDDLSICQKPDSALKGTLHAFVAKHFQSQRLSCSRQVSTYDWNAFSRNAHCASLPPGVALRSNSDEFSIKDGNHRSVWLLAEGYTHAPYWVYDAYAHKLNDPTRMLFRAKFSC